MSINLQRAEGRAAALIGRPRTSNPYGRDLPTLREDWFGGWDSIAPERRGNFSNVFSK